MKKLLLCITVLFMLVAAVPVSAYDSVTPAQAFDLVANETGYYILDVRTAEEWKWVGHPGKNKLGEGSGLTGKVVEISYQIAWKKEFIVNPSFMTDIDGLFGTLKDSVVLITMCRSGQRSAKAAAALEAAGYQVLDMPEGFEGGTDSRGYRTKNGWKLTMPYTYSGVGYED